MGIYCPLVTSNPTPYSPGHNITSPLKEGKVREIKIRYKINE
jgi:hypothetical protein